MNQLFVAGRKFAMANLEWLVLSLLIGFIIWVIAAVDSNPVQQRDFSEQIPIQYKLAEDEAVLRDTSFAQQTTRVTVELRAPRSTWDALSTDDIRVVADVSNLPSGTYDDIKLTAEIVNEDLRGRIISISPSTISLRLVDAGEKLVQVAPEISVRPSIEYDVNESNITCEPSQITVRGQSPRVARVVKAVVRLNASELTATDTVSGSILLFDAQENLVTGLTIDDENVLCQVEVKPREGEALTVVTQITGTLPDGYSQGEVTVEPAEIFVVGDATAIASMNGEYVVEVDVTDAKGKFSKIITVDDLPEGVTLQQGTEDITVTVVVNENPQTVTFTDVTIRVINRDTGLNVELSPLAATVDITAPQSVINDLTADNISLVVDVAGLGEGEHSDLVIEYELLTEALQNANPIVVIRPETITAIISVLELPTPTPDSVFGKSVGQ